MRHCCLFIIFSPPTLSHVQVWNVPSMPWFQKMTSKCHFALYFPMTAAQIKFKQPWPGWYFPPSTVLSDKQEQPVSLPPFLTLHLWPESHQNDWPTCQGTITRIRDRHMFSDGMLQALLLLHYPLPVFSENKESTSLTVLCSSMNGSQKWKMDRWVQTVHGHGST